ncbi:MAG: hypothetical protein O9353_03240, partial [Bacteroidia bacterium]|nr:hypothetical protein [Bacteroidia bacterium]
YQLSAVIEYVIAQAPVKDSAAGINDAISSIDADVFFFAVHNSTATGINQAFDPYYFLIPFTIRFRHKKTAIGVGSIYIIVAFRKLFSVLVEEPYFLLIKDLKNRGSGKVVEV